MAMDTETAKQVTADEWAAAEAKLEQMLNKACVGVASIMGISTFIVLFAVMVGTEAVTHGSAGGLALLGLLIVSYMIFIGALTFRGVVRNLAEWNDERKLLGPKPE